MTTGIAALDAVSVEHRPAPPPSPLAGRWGDEIGEGAPPQWLAKGWLARDCLAVMFGEPGSYKSFLALDLALCLASGASWLDRKTACAPVLYCALEGGAGLARRVKAWTLHHDRPAPADFRLVSQSLPLIGQGNRLADTLAEIAHMRAEGRAPALVVIDTLSRALNGGDENTPSDMGALVKAADAIREASGAAVLLIHHSGKTASAGARGHSLLRGAADIEIRCEAAGTLAASLTLTKSKDGEAGLELPVDLIEVALGVDQDGDPVRSLVCAVSNRKPVKASGPRLKPRERIMLDALRTITGDKPDLSSWREACDAAGFSLSDKPNTRLIQFRRGAERLQELGFITVSGEAVALSDNHDTR